MIEFIKVLLLKKHPILIILFTISMLLYSFFDKGNFITLKNDISKKFPSSIFLFMIFDISVADDDT